MLQAARVRSKQESEKRAELQKGALTYDLHGLRDLVEPEGVAVPAYLIGTVTVEDAEGFAEYAKRVPEVVERYGGTFRARGGTVEVLEGSWAPKRVVLVEFDSLEQAKLWYDSEEYQALADIRRRCAETDMVLVEGV